MQKYDDDKEFLLNVLREEFKQTGKTPKYKNEHRNVDTRVFKRLFGSWREALQLAGIPVRERSSVPCKIEKLCMHCESVFESKTKTALFCSVKCSNYSRRKYPKQEVKSKEEKQQARQILLREKSYNYMMLTDFNSLGWDVKRRRVIHEQNGACNKCHNTTWLGEAIVLEVDHIDGNNKNNERNNLEAICPNCHSLTKTWRGRNKKTDNNVSDEMLLDAFISEGNIRKALLKLGLAGKGKNYERVKKILTSSGLNFNI